MTNAWNVERLECRMTNVECRMVGVASLGLIEKVMSVVPPTLTQADFTY